MHIHAVIHALFEKPGVIKDWAAEKNYTFTETHTYRGEKLPRVNEFDFLIIMGGPQSPREVEQFPYLRHEIALTQQAIKENKAILGVCLGAQIIAEALGGTTQRSPNKEIGMFPITLNTAAKQDPLFKTFPEQFDVMHWHNDMPGISDEMVLLASSAGCPQQAFCYHDRIYGFQFHLEFTRALVEEMIENCPQDLAPGQYIRSKEHLLASDFTEINNILFSTLDYLASRLVLLKTKDFSVA